MKKILFLFIVLLYVELHAMDRVSTLKVYHGIFSALTAKKANYVYTNDKEYRKVFRSSKLIHIANRPQDAEILFITNSSTLEYILKNEGISQSAKKTVIFVTKYNLLKYSDEVVGALYWKKGRSQLLFIEQRLKKYDIVLPKAFQNFMIDEL